MSANDFIVKFCEIIKIMESISQFGENARHMHKRDMETMTDLDLLESVLIIMKGSESVETFENSCYAVNIAVDRLRRAYHSGEKKDMVLSFAAHFENDRVNRINQMGGETQCGTDTK